MSRARDNGLRRRRGAGFAWVAIGLTWVVLGLVVGWWASRLRDDVRGQILSRDGQILLAMARVQEGASGPLGEDDGALAGEWVEHPMDVFIHIAGREGMVAGWLFDAEGEFKMALPMAIREGAIPDAAQSALKAGLPYSRFEPSLSLAEVFWLPELLGQGSGNETEDETVSVVEVYVPLRGVGGEGRDWVAGFLIDAGSLVVQFAALDRQLVVQALTVMGVAMGISGVTLGLVFRRLNRAHRLVEQRTDDLLRANRELSRSARVAALGAVTAHLVHGLKNPVSGLQTFVSSFGELGGGDRDGDWREAKAATQRMQTLIQDVVRVIREQEADLEYEVPLEEVGQAVIQRVRAVAERRRIRLELKGARGRDLDNRVSGLLALMLGNLVENAIEATPDGGRVTLHLREEGVLTVCDVIDEGPGIAVATQGRLFQPQLSTKEGGSGLGLAITRQLALSLGGDARLIRSDAGGSVFRIEFPRDVARADGVLGGGRAGGDAPLGAADPVRA